VQCAYEIYAISGQRRFLGYTGAAAQSLLPGQGKELPLQYDEDGVCCVTPISTFKNFDGLKKAPPPEQPSAAMGAAP